MKTIQTEVIIPGGGGVIDWENPANNDFLLVSQFSVTGTLSAT